MVKIRQGEHDVTELDQLTLEVRRDCDLEYLRRASAFIQAKAARGAPFFVSCAPRASWSVLTTRAVERMARIPVHRIDHEASVHRGRRTILR